MFQAFSHVLRWRWHSLQCRVSGFCHKGKDWPSIPFPQSQIHASDYERNAGEIWGGWRGAVGVGKFYFIVYIYEILKE